MKNIIKIGTRKSKLALIQTDIVKDKIKKAFPEIEVEIVKIDTKGDQILDKSLTSFCSILSSSKFSACSKPFKLVILLLLPVNVLRLCISFKVISPLNPRAF